jgi:cell division protein FtsI/penicillin-binding protein 2
MIYSKRLYTLCSVLLAFAVFDSSAELPSLQRELDRAVTSPLQSAIVADAYTGKILAAANAGLLTGEKLPPGSLMKVFTLLTYISERGIDTPVYHCPASLSSDRKGCWNRNGHGEVNAEKALAYSCNVYFRQLAKRTSPESFARTIYEFGLIRNESEILSMPENTVRKLMVGDTLEWTTETSRVLRAYCALMNGGWIWPDGNDKGRRVVVPLPAFEKIQNGLKRSVREGTSFEAGRLSGVEMTGKTGTSLLMVNGKADVNRTQGLWIGMYPADHPKIAVMTFVREGRGATDAAPLGGRVLSYYLQATHHK